MAQDDRRRQPPSTRGQSPAPTAPDTPASHEMNAPPLPEAPDAPDASPPADAPAAAPAPAAAESETGTGTETETERLRREVREAQQSLEAKEEALARHEAQRQAEEATATMVNDYAAEVPALNAHTRGLRQYQTAETSFLEEILPAQTRADIADVDKAPRKEIDDLRAKIDKEEGDAAKARRDLADARATAAAARERSEALKRPAASIKDRLKGADAVRSDAKKASDLGNYALAYWLVMEGGKLDQAIEAEPEIIAPAALSAAIATAADEQAKADKAVEELESQVAALDTSLQEDRTRLATLERTVDATILAALAKLNPPSAEAA